MTQFFTDLVVEFTTGVDDIDRKIIRAINIIHECDGDRDDALGAQARGDIRDLIETWLSVYEYGAPDEAGERERRRAGELPGVRIEWPETACPDPVAAIIQKGLQLADAPRSTCIELEWAHSASRYVIDGFGGGVGAIFRDQIIWSFDAYQLAKLAEIEARRSEEMAELARKLNEKYGFKSKEE